MNVEFGVNKHAVIPLGAGAARHVACVTRPTGSLGKGLSFGQRSQTSCSALIHGNVSEPIGSFYQPVDGARSRGEISTLQPF